MTGQASFHGRVPSQKHWASIRPRTNTASKTWASIRTRTNTLCKKRELFARLKATHSSAADKYPLKKHEAQVFAMDGRIPSQKHGASIRLGTNTFLKIKGKVFVLWTNTQNDGASVRPWTNNTYSTNGFPEYEYSSNLFVQPIRIRAGVQILDGRRYFLPKTKHLRCPSPVVS